MFEMKQLPFALNALEPYMSQRTLEFHYGKHYKAYLDKLNELIVGKVYEKMSLPEIIAESFKHNEDKAIYNNAGQVFNHEFFWRSLSAGGAVMPSKEVMSKIEQNFGSYDAFKQEFKTKAVGQFGSGWCWAVEKDGKIDIVATSNADNPISLGLGKPLVCVDVWEHAYYLDYQNRRLDFVSAWLDNMIKW